MKYRIFSLVFALNTLLTAAASADRLDDMISPVTAPTNFEDPRNISELRPIYIHHKINDKFITEGGDVNIYALQLRYAVSDKFSLIATKDGYVDFNPKSTVPNDEGFANIAVGGKYTVYQCEDSIGSVGLRYEAPTGDKEVFQGTGDGAINPFFSAAYAVNNWNFMGSTGLRFRIDDKDSSFFDLNLHTSYKIGNFYPLFELGLINVIAEGERLPISDEGEDFFNFGSSDSKGETILTAAVGARYRLTKAIDLGAAYQFPFESSDGNRIIDHRVTTDLIYRF